jgi:uncharacterized protein YpbB
MQEKTPKKEKNIAREKADTKLESYKLYQSGKTIKEIAESRNLSVTTIETHIAHYIEKGNISIEELVSKEKILLIEPLAKTIEGNALNPLKQQLGNDVSYGEIKFVLASLAHLKQKDSTVEDEL